MRRRVDLAALEEDLEAALMNAMMGDAWGRGLQGRLELVAKATLHRYGLSRARVRVTGGRGLVEVAVDLPQQGPRVQSIQLRFGGL